MKSHHRVRKVLLTFAALALAYGVPAHSTDYSGYAKCLSTPLVDVRPATIAGAAANTPALSTLAALVKKAGLVPALDNPNARLTVYAPTNDAFKKIDSKVSEAIVNNIPLLTNVLTYHVSQGLKDPRLPPHPREERTLLKGQTVFLDYDKRPQVNQSNANCQGVRTSNGIVWIIDSVLLPQFR